MKALWTPSQTEEGNLGKGCPGEREHMLSFPNTPLRVNRLECCEKSDRIPQTPRMWLPTSEREPHSALDFLLLPWPVMSFSLFDLTPHLP